MIYFLDYDDEFGPIDVEDRVARRNNYRLSTLKWWSRSVVRGNSKHTQECKFTSQLGGDDKEEN